jgi:hypothetical protein
VDGHFDRSSHEGLLIHLVIKKFVFVDVFLRALGIENESPFFVCPFSSNYRLILEVYEVFLDAVEDKFIKIYFRDINDSCPFLVFELVQILLLDGGIEISRFDLDLALLDACVLVLITFH